MECGDLSPLFLLVGMALLVEVVCDRITEKRRQVGALQRIARNKFGATGRNWGERFRIDKPRQANPRSAQYKSNEARNMECGDLSPLFLSGPAFLVRRVC